MPVSGDVVTLSFSLAVNNTPTGFWGNFIQAMNDNQGAITAIVGMLTVLVLVIQLCIMYRQAKISNRANEISREVAFLPIKKEMLFNVISETIKTQTFFIKFKEVEKYRNNFIAIQEARNLFLETEIALKNLENSILIAKNTWDLTFLSSINFEEIHGKIEELDDLAQKSEKEKDWLANFEYIKGKSLEMQNKIKEASVLYEKIKIR
ncbi:MULTISPECIES: hypothetical protein [Dethiosulfovibrio]|uniref:Uncharacterized protein n=2 Tax=Dethiosulfovibrio TaxID=47054 RepID=A0ABS9EV37_9BACT|nr:MULTISPECIES: hypothetical protein [Dethiosulfovibrio]MCF4115122.1 hypothetical protein [Dethiosulfovibrio russensis]MCF4143598.1 hypothetical protein [Dethiosulfovibrio marinus]MCF4146069.1 hypothetical protein [Dethiosulfovibrio acidaminovorans]